MRSRANFLSLWWLIIAIIEFCAYSLQTWGFGYASEKMVRRVRFESFRAILRQEIAFFDRTEHSTGSLTTMLSTEATSMAGLSGVNLGAILTVLVNLTSGIIVSYIPPPTHTHQSPDNILLWRRVTDLVG